MRSGQRTLCQGSDSVVDQPAATARGLRVTQLIVPCSSQTPEDRETVVKGMGNSSFIFLGDYSFPLFILKKKDLRGLTRMQRVGKMKA